MRQGDLDIFLGLSGLGFLYHSHAVGWYLLSVPEGLDVQKVVELLNLNPLIAHADLESFGGVGRSTPTDYYYTTGNQWNLTRINMPNAWSRTQGNANYAVAILDTGVMYQPNSNPVWHEDLYNKLGRHPNGDMLGFNEVTNISYPYSGYYPNDNTGHGTFVSGIIGAQTSFNSSNTYGIAGVSPNAPIVPVKVLEGYTNDGDITRLRVGIEHAVSIGTVKVLNLSLQNYGFDQNTLETLKVANNNDDLIVSIVGNDGDYPYGSQSFWNSAGIGYPGAYWRVMAVGATDEQDNLVGYSITAASPSGGINSGLLRSGPQVSVVAPGGRFGNPIFSTSLYSPYYGYAYRMNPGGTYEAGYGTSFAAPHVAGLAHLCKSLFQSMTWYDLQSHIEDTALDLNQYNGYPGFDQFIGWGRIDADRATLVTLRAVPMPIRPGSWQLITIPMWPTFDPTLNKSLDWRTLFGPNLTDTSRGFTALWADPTLPTSSNLLDYSDVRVPRVGPGRSYWVKLSTDRDANGNPLPPATASYNLNPTWGGAYPFMEQTHPVVAHIKPRTPDIAFGQPGHQGASNMIGVAGVDPLIWNRDTILVRLPQSDGTAEVITLREAKQRNLVEQWGQRWNANTQQIEIVAEPGTPNVPSGYTVVNQVPAGEGVWLYTNVECQILLPHK